MPPPNHFANMGRTAGEGESEIVIQRISQPFTDPMKIFVDDQMRLRLKNGESGTIIVPNGTHTIRATHFIGAFWGRSYPLTIEAMSSRVVIETKFNGYLSMGLDQIGLKTYAQFKLDGSNAPLPVPSPSAPSQPAPKQFAPAPSKEMDQAIQKTIASIIKKLPKGSTIAVINVSSNDNTVSSLALNEVEFNFVSSDRFTVVDRSKLDVIRKEQELQMSGDVSDESIVAIGSLAGAGIVITGDITDIGNKKRLSLKALDVKTGQILSMAREDY
jgi:hypothetical protein